MRSGNRAAYKLRNFFRGILRAKDSKKSVGSQEQPQSAETIQAWLVSRLARELRVEPHEIDSRDPFSYYGLDSRTAVTLSGELEDWLGRRLSPTLLWDYPTIEALARYLAQESDVSESATSSKH